MLVFLRMVYVAVLALGMSAHHDHGKHGVKHRKSHLWRYCGQFFITGYTATGARTATGTIARWGEVAVDPSTIPLGSHVWIDGLGTFHAEDTGGAVQGNHIDVFVNTISQAYTITGYRRACWT